MVNSSIYCQLHDWSIISQQHDSTLLWKTEVLFLSLKHGFMKPVVHIVTFEYLKLYYRTKG